MKKFKFDVSATYEVTDRESFKCEAEDEEEAVSKLEKHLWEEYQCEAYSVHTKSEEDIIEPPYIDPNQFDLPLEHQ